MSNPQIPGKILFREDENIRLPAHWHNSIEICFFLQGGFRAYIDYRCVNVQNEELLVINSGQMHYVGEKSVGDNLGITLAADMVFGKKYVRT